MMTIPRTTIAVIFKNHGKPENVLQMMRVPLFQESEKHSILVRMKAAPINPADLNSVEGRYPVKLHKMSLPPNETGCLDGLFVPGFEGSGEIASIKQNKYPQKDLFGSNLSIGDRVIIGGGLENGFGTWRRDAYALPSSLIRINNQQLDFATLSVLSVNPCTAYRLLSEDFCKLSPGDTIIQNAGTSSVAQSIIQIAQIRGLNTINVIRDRPNFTETANILKSFGRRKNKSLEDIKEEFSNIVVLKEETMYEELQNMKITLPKLALNAVGGKSAENLIRALCSGGTMVTYGGMAKEPFKVSASSMIFKDIILRGFWMNRWRKKNEQDLEYKKMINDLLDMVSTGKLILLSKNSLFSLENGNNNFIKKIVVHNDISQSSKFIESNYNQSSDISLDLSSKNLMKALRYPFDMCLEENENIKKYHIGSKKTIFFFE